MARIAIFLLVVLSVVTGVHLYFWVRLVRDTDLPPPYRAWVTGAIIALAACLPLPFLLVRRLSPDWARFVAWPAYVWMGFMFLLFATLVALDVVRLFTQTATRLAVGAALDTERRTFLARLLGMLAGSAAGVTGALAVGRGLAAPVVKEVAVRLRRLPRASHGTTIVQLTDVHVGPTIGRAFVEDVVRRTNALAPDLVVITGDLVDGSVEALWGAVSELGKLRARHGVFFVTGNHEYFSGVRPWMEALERLGIRVLQNERVAIGEGAGGFDLAGVHDFSAKRFDAGLGPDLPAALAGRDPTRELVLLAHQPKAVREAAKLGVGLQISGHTHGGQIWPFSYLVRLAQPFVLGLHRQGDTQIYVSAGTAYWGPPMRLGTQGEITKITLLSETV